MGKRHSAYITTETDSSGHTMYQVYDLRGNWYPFEQYQEAQAFLEYIRETQAFNPLSAGFKTPMDMCLKKWQEAEVVAFAPDTESVMVAFKSGEGGNQVPGYGSWTREEEISPPADWQI